MKSEAKHKRITLIVFGVAFLVGCDDQCPDDPDKTAPGICGCGVPDTDSDGDGTPDCNDACPNDPNKTAPGDCGCGTADTDSDADGTPDCGDGEEKVLLDLGGALIWQR